MLYELLAGEHPYWREDQAEYAKRVKAYAAKPPALLGLMPAPASNAEVSSALHRCLSPDPAARPTAAALRAILSGRGEKLEVPAATARGTKYAIRSGGISREPIVSDGIELSDPTAVVADRCAD